MSAGKTPKTRPSVPQHQQYHYDHLPVLDLSRPEDIGFGIRCVTDEVCALTAAVRNLRRELAGLSLNEPWWDLIKRGLKERR